MAIIGVIFVASIPTLLHYRQASMLKAAAEEVASALNRGRLLAVTQNRSVCFQVVANQYQYTYGCGGPVVAVPGADAAGFFRLANNNTIVLSNGGPSPVFDYLGTATTAGTLTVTYLGPTGAAAGTRNVMVSGPGRIQIQ